MYYSVIVLNYIYVAFYIVSNRYHRRLNIFLPTTDGAKQILTLYLGIQNYYLTSPFLGDGP